MVKVLNLNLWNYNDFEERKPKVIKFIKKHDPDVIVLQEVRDDLQFNEEGNNQAKQLNESLGYPHLLFYPVTDKRNERPEKYKLQCFEGTAVLSKFPIIKSEEKLLKKHKDDMYHCGNLYFKIKAEKEIDFIAVHFSPNELFSLLHLIETLKYADEKKIKPIIKAARDYEYDRTKDYKISKSRDQKFDYMRPLYYTLLNYKLVKKLT